MRNIIVFLILLFTMTLYAEGTEEIFSFSLSGDPDTLDPHATTGTLTFQVLRSVYDTLVEPDQEGNIIPALAESWEVSEDGLRWIFRLRKDAWFHHGKQADADDVIASLERILDPDFASPSAFEFAAIEELSHTDPFHVVLRLSKPHAPLLASLASGWAAILPADLIASQHNFSLHPIGTGPFRFVEWQRDRSIQLTSFDRYWKGAPRLKELEFAIIKDPSVQVYALFSGTVQGVDILVEPELSRVRAHEDSKVYESLSGLVHVISLNTRKYPFDSLEFRQALNAAIDKERVLDIAYGGGIEVQSFMDAGNQYAISLETRGYDPEWARSIFAKVPLEKPLLLSVPQNFHAHVRAAEMYQEMFRQAGLEVEIELLDWQRWLSEVYRQHMFDMTVIGHTGKLDPDGRLTPYGTDETYVGWINEEFVQLSGEARRESDPQLRKNLYADALRIIGEELPFVYVGTSTRYVGLSTSVKGFRMSNQLETFDFRDVTYR